MKHCSLRMSSYLNCCLHYSWRAFYQVIQLIPVVISTNFQREVDQIAYRNWSRWLRSEIRWSRWMWHFRFLAHQFDGARCWPYVLLHCHLETKFSPIVWHVTTTLLMILSRCTPPVIVPLQTWNRGIPRASLTTWNYLERTYITG